MTKQQEKREGFLRAYKMLPSLYQPVVRKLIINKCGWSDINGFNSPTFHAKKRGSAEITILEKEAIEEIFAEYHLDPWTGRYIGSMAEFNTLINGK